MPDRAISVRLDARADDALRRLMSDGLSQSEAIRVALLEAASRRRPERSLSVEALMLAESEEDRRESADVLAFMESLGAPWPDDPEG